jgi:DNA polymerase
MNDVSDTDFADCAQPLREALLASTAVVPTTWHVVVLDIEARCVLDLEKVGAVRWIKRAMLLCLCYAIDGGPVQLWKAGEPIPADLLAALNDPDYLIVAHNAHFERTFFKHVLIHHGWPEVPLARWRCTQAMCLTLALPAALDKAAIALKLPVQKADGAIARRMAKPRKALKGEGPDVTHWHEAPEDFAELYAYCAIDVEVTRLLWRHLPKLTEHEQQIWQIDQIVNDRGYYTDGDLVDKAIAIIDAVKRALEREFKQLTGLTPNQRDKILQWLIARGCKLPDLKREHTLEPYLLKAAGNLAPDARRAIEIRCEYSYAATHKFYSLRNQRDIDGRVRGSSTYRKASTGRWSASGVQPHNLKKEDEIDADLKVYFAAVMTGDLEIVRKLGPPLKVIGLLIRAAICAPPGRKLIHGDYSAIESRTLAWVTDEKSKLALWAKFDETKDPADDPYVIFGLSIGHPEETARKWGKICDLAFGYGGGVGAWKNFAPDDDSSTEQQIKGYQLAWRQRHPRTWAFWYAIEDAAIAAVRDPDEPAYCGRFKLYCERICGLRLLFIELPSGRRLAYPGAEVISRINPNTGEPKPALSFMDNAQGKWVKVRNGQGVWGGHLCENLIQAVARDHLADAILRLEAAGYPVVVHVHDSICAEVPDGRPVV